MTWMISRVYDSDDDDNRPILVIEGFDDSVYNKCLRSTIRRTTLDDVSHYQFNFDEFISISVINSDEVYEICIGFETHINKYMDMQSKPSVPITNNHYL